MIWALVGALSLALFLCLEPTYGAWEALIGVGLCFVAAAIGGGPFLLYAIWADRK